MPKIVDKEAVRRAILAQNQPFTPDTIARMGVSTPSYAYNLIREMIGIGNVNIQHKDGRRIFYGVVNRQGQQAIQNNKGILGLAPAERFKYVGHCIDMVVDKVSPSLLVTGVAGIGKSYLVRQRLENGGLTEGDEWHLMGGHSSPMGLYKFLHDHCDSTIVFDDCDSVFKDETSINILKSALDSFAVRRVCWQSARMPEDLEPQFEFTGQIIFISNMDACQIDEAVKSRTIVIDLQMSRTEICEYLHELTPVIEPQMDMIEKNEVLKYLEDNCQAFENFNIRTFIKACRIRKSADKHGNDWKKMIMVVI